jgi:hypothetical protein
VNMDEPYLVLGSRHRVLFHDPISAAAIAMQLYPNDPRAVEAAFGHIVLDWMCSNDPVFKAQLEFLAERDARERARIRRQKKVGKKSGVVDAVNRKSEGEGGFGILSRRSKNS